MTEEIITPEIEHPEEELEKAVEEDEEAVENEFVREQEEVTRTVLESAHELEQLSGERLTGSLGGALTGLATAPATNPLEIITHAPAEGSRYDVLRTQLARESDVGTPSVNRAKVDLLATLLGHDLTEGMPSLEAKASATTLLTHLVYAAKGQPLPELTSSPASQAVGEVSGKLASMSDATFWELFASASEGMVADSDLLRDQLAMMGMAHELQPLKAQFTWPTGDAVALQVDELVAAATIDPDYVDLAQLYRRAGSLSLNGQPIPRAIMTELIRMAVADLITQSKWAESLRRTPPASAVKQLLAAEPIDATPAAADRNEARSAAKRLVTQAEGMAKRRPSPETAAREVQSRASRGYLRESVDFLLARLKHRTGTLPGGAKAATKLDAAVKKSSLLPALERWSAAYRAGETDPRTLKTLLDDVTMSRQALEAQLGMRFPDGSGSGKAAVENAMSFIEAVNPTLVEVGLEAAELLRTPPTFTSNPLAGPAATAEQSTVRARTRIAAVRAVNGEAGLPKFLDAVLPSSLRSSSWATTLRNAAVSWTTAETRDAAQVAKAASAFGDALGSARAELGTNWDPGAVFVGEGVVDALAAALAEKITALSRTDPQIKAQLAQQLADLATFELQPPTIDDLAAYWRTTKAGVKAVPNVRLDLAAKLSAWQVAAADPADTAALAAATYDVVDALIGSRGAITESALSDADKAVLLRALDDVGAGVASRMAALAHP